jgi:hypothetical protein
MSGNMEQVSETDRGGGLRWWRMEKQEAGLTTFLAYCTVKVASRVLILCILTRGYYLPKCVPAHCLFHLAENPQGRAQPNL